MKKLAGLVALAFASIALVACGGGSGGGTTTEAGGGETGAGAAAGNAGKSAPAGGESSTLKFETDPSGQLAYTTTQMTGKAGNTTVELNNSQALAHDVAIEDSSGNLVGKTETVAESSATAVVDLKPGTYTYYCTVPGHREAGMEGTLTVK
jgi:plastocyanin